MLRSSLLVLAVLLGFATAPACGDDCTPVTDCKAREGVDLCFDPNGPLARSSLFDPCLVGVPAGYSSCDFDECAGEDMCSPTLSRHCAKLQEAVLHERGWVRPSCEEDSCPQGGHCVDNKISAPFCVLD